MAEAVRGDDRDRKLHTDYAQFFVDDDRNAALVRAENRVAMIADIAAKDCFPSTRKLALHYIRSVTGKIGSSSLASFSFRKINKPVVKVEIRFYKA